jgi:hypothetical protein
VHTQVARSARAALSLCLLLLPLAGCAELSRSDPIRITKESPLPPPPPPAPVAAEQQRLPGTPPIVDTAGRGAPVPGQPPRPAGKG